MYETNTEMVRSLRKCITFCCTLGLKIEIKLEQTNCSLYLCICFLKEFKKVQNCHAMSCIFFSSIFTLPFCSCSADMTNEEFLEYWLILPWGKSNSTMLVLLDIIHCFYWVVPTYSWVRLCMSIICLVIVDTNGRDFIYILDRPRMLKNHHPHPLVLCLRARLASLS